LQDALLLAGQRAVDAHAESADADQALRRRVAGVGRGAPGAGGNVNRSMKSARAMVPLLMCLLLVQAAEAASGKPQAQATDLKQEVIKFEKEWWEAFKVRDKAALERILADEFLGFDNAAGEPRTKGQWIAAYAVDKNFRVDSYSIERIDVIVVADTAVAAVHYSAHFTVNGKASSDRAIDLDTLVRRNGRWQALATAEVPVTTPK